MSAVRMEKAASSFLKGVMVKMQQALPRKPFLMVTSSNIIIAIKWPSYECLN